VRLVGIPDKLPESRELPTRTVFEKYVGHAFVIAGFNNVGMAELHVESVTGSIGETIWVESEFLELV
jgi:hypothetical protein